MSCDLHVAKSDRYSQHIINRSCFLSISACTPLSSELATQNTVFFLKFWAATLAFPQSQFAQGARETKGGSQSSRGDATGFVGILGQRNVFEDPPFFSGFTGGKEEGQRVGGKAALGKGGNLAQGERSEAKEEGGAQRGDGQMHLLSLDIFGRMEGCLSHFQSCVEQFSRYPFFMALQTTFVTLTPA